MNKMKLLLENWRKYTKEPALTKNEIEDAIQNASFNSNNSSSHRWAVGQPYVDYWIDKNTGKWMFSAGIPDGTPNADKWPKKASEPGESLHTFLKRVEEPVQLNLFEYYEVDALTKDEEYCPVCAKLEEEEACKPSKGKRFAKRVDGKCRSFGQAGQAKSGGDRIRPGTKKGDAYCARSAGIKKCKNPPCANTLSRKKWKCQGKKSMKEQNSETPT